MEIPDRSNSDREDQLYEQIVQAGLPLPKRQVPLPDTGRDFVWDFGWEGTPLLVEVQGGTWRGRRTAHSTGSGIRRDAIKNNVAVLAGKVVLYFTSDMIVNFSALDTLRRYFGFPVIERAVPRKHKMTIIVYFDKLVDGQQVPASTAFVTYRPDGWTPTMRWVNKKVKSMDGPNIKVRTIFTVDERIKNANPIQLFKDTE